jgi:hypothetical protein
MVGQGLGALAGDSRPAGALDRLSNLGAELERVESDLHAFMLRIAPLPPPTIVSAGSGGGGAGGQVYAVVQPPSGVHPLLSSMESRVGEIHATIKRLNELF